MSSATSASGAATATAADDRQELNRFATYQRERNYRQIPANWDALVRNITSNLYAEEQKGLNNDSVSSPGQRCVFEGSSNRENGDTILHLMCMGYPSASAVGAVLKYHSLKNGNCKCGQENGSDIEETFVSQKNHRGATPLHVAVRCGASEDTIALLIKYQRMRNATPLASISMPGGTYPLQVACSISSSISPEVFKLLVKDDPTIVRKSESDNDEDLTPLHLMWIAHCYLLGLNKSNTANQRDQRVRNTLRQIGYEIQDQPYEDLSNLRADIWTKTKILLLDPSYVDLNTTHGQMSSEKIFHPVHALANYPRCPPALMHLALETQKELCHHLSQRDESGKIPLHYAAVAGPSDVWTQPNKHDHLFEQTLIEVLVKANPETCKMEDETGSLPLHLAILSGKKWEMGIAAIIDAYPDALDMLEPSTGFYPFMLAALQHLPTIPNPPTSTSTPHSRLSHQGQNNYRMSVETNLETLNNDVDFDSLNFMVTLGRSNEPNMSNQVKTMNTVNGCDVQLTLIYNLLQACPEVVNQDHLIFKIGHLSKDSKKIEE